MRYLRRTGLGNSDETRHRGGRGNPRAIATCRAVGSLAASQLAGSLGKLGDEDGCSQSSSVVWKARMFGDIESRVNDVLAIPKVGLEAGSVLLGSSGEGHFARKQGSGIGFGIVVPSGDEDAEDFFWS